MLYFSWKKTRQTQIGENKKTRTGLGIEKIGLDWRESANESIENEAGSESTVLPSVVVAQK